MVSEIELRRIMSGRWLMPILAHLADGGGSRFANMLAQLKLSRSALSSSLGQLIQAGWIARASGHGHPLRPEYVITGPGEPVAAFCRKVMAQRRRLGLEPAGLPRWSLSVAAQLRHRPSRFTALRLALQPVTPRALSMTLKQMLASELVNRNLEESFPPVPIYDLSRKGRRLAEALDA